MMISASPPKVKIQDMNSTLPIHPKPKYGHACNSCGFCCSTEPCDLASEYLDSHSGPCIALEIKNGKSGCGLVRNPLGYLYRKVHPGTDVAILDDSVLIERGAELSAQIAAALGVGRGCDSLDDQQSAQWPHVIPTKLIG